MNISKNSPIYKILDIARWAPSGDNSQPWRFRIMADDVAQVYIYLNPLLAFNRDHLGTYLAAGMLLASIRMAASSFGGHIDIQKSEQSDSEKLVYDIRFISQSVMPHELAPFITSRSVCRRAYTTRPVGQSIKKSLQKAVGDNYEIIWYEKARKWQFIPALFVNAKLRIFSADIFNEYCRAIDWENEYSETKMPSTTLGLSRMTRFVARFFMRSWVRFNFFNRYLLGYFLPVMEMDVVPGVMCGAHCVIKARSRPGTIDEYVSAGEAVQRFWLTATQQGLLHQPHMTPLIFSQYALEADMSSERADIRHLLEKLKSLMLDILGGPEELNRTVWAGRIGYGTPGRSRSGRRSLYELLEN